MSAVSGQPRIRCMSLERKRMNGDKAIEHYDDLRNPSVSWFDASNSYSSRRSNASSVLELKNPKECWESYIADESNSSQERIKALNASMSIVEVDNDAMDVMEKSSEDAQHVSGTLNPELLNLLVSFVFLIMLPFHYGRKTAGSSFV